MKCGFSSQLLLVCLNLEHYVRLDPLSSWLKYFVYLCVIFRSLFFPVLSAKKKTKQTNNKRYKE